MKFSYYTDKLDNYVSRGGPIREEYNDLNELFSQVMKEHGLQRQVIENYIEQSALVSAPTIQGHILRRPYGYHGDFEIINRIYDTDIVDDPHLKKWDEYFHSGSAAKAVRGRREFLKDLLLLHFSKNPSLRILNVASGPCREVSDFFRRIPASADVLFDCIDADPNAVEFGQKLLHQEIKQGRVNIGNKNAFRLKVEGYYDLCYSAGLFDYFDDRTFVRIMQKMLRSLKNDGTVVIGNFGQNNTQRSYMEFGGWRLHHRNPEKLIELSIRAGLAEQNIDIRTEINGVNHFIVAQVPFC